MYLRISQLVSIVFIFPCSFFEGYSRDVCCFGLLAKSKFIKKRDEFAYCSNSSVYILQNATFCLPVLKSGVDMYVNWYSQVTLNIKEFSPGSSSYSLLYGRWTIQGLKENEDFVYNHTTLKSYYPSLSLVIARAAVEFIHRVQWERVAVITDISNDFFLHTAELFYKTFTSSIKIHYVQLLHSEKAIDRTLKEIQKLKFRIIIVSLPLHILRQLMCVRLIYNMIWPDYAWLVIGLDQQTFLELTCNDQIIVFLQRIHDRELDTMNCQYDHTLNCVSIGSNSLTVCNCQQFNVKTYAVDIYHFREKLEPISNYSIKYGLSSVTLHPVPLDLPLQSSLIAYIIFSLIYLPVLIVLTVTLLLYIRFRNEPEVKATGVSLNILIFIACYLLLVYPALHNLNILPNFERVNLNLRNFFCFFYLWTNGLSLPTAVILSILLVKLVRVYRFFHYFVIIKKWECHDLTLAIYVFLLTSPVIIMCIAQSIAHKYVSTVRKHFRNGQFNAFLECRGPYEFHWGFGQLAYLFVLSLMLVVMAIKTRKIKHENFKDTKKVITLMMILFMTSCLCTVYVFIFEALELHFLYSSTLLIIGQCSFVIECIFFLYVPKIYPIIKQNISLKLAK